MTRERMRETVQNSVRYRGRGSNLNRWLTVALLAVCGFSARAEQAPSFEIRLGQDGETIGEAQPVFIEIQQESMPAISVREVARRYQKLLETADDPAVRVDALHRLTNLQAIAGDQLDISPQQEEALYRQAVDSYEMIVGSGVYYGRIDELLYQNAKAYALIGDEANSIKRLEQLIGLYPGSEYALESRFRIAEHQFSAGDYAAAERAYRDVLTRDPDSRFADLAAYMLGWSQFKLDQREDAARRFIAVLDRHVDANGDFENLSQVEANLVDDTFRILSIIAAYEGGAEVFERLLAGRSPGYEYLLYDRLADYYRLNERYTDSVAASESFIARHPDHPKAPALARQIVETYEEGRFANQAQAARESYIAQFGTEQWVERLTDQGRAALLAYLDEVGRYYYRQGQQASSAAARTANYRRAARYIEQWTALQPNGSRGEQLMLAADAWIRAGEPDRALPLYEIAGYREGEYDTPADAAYAALLLYRDRLDATEGPGGQALKDMVSASERFITVHMQDERASAVRAYAANALFDRGLARRAAAMAEPLTRDENASVEERRAGWLIRANAAYGEGDFVAAERFYREALDIMEAGDKNQDEAERKLAASIYRQGEIAAGAGQIDKAVANFLRIATVVPGSDIVMKARYDAANALLVGERWDAAINALSDFQRRYPNTDLARETDDKLIHAYRQSGQHAAAAGVLLAQAGRGGVSPRETWQMRITAAEWYEQADEITKAHRIYGDYLARGTADFGTHEYQQELRWMLAGQAAADGSVERAADRYRQILTRERQATATAGTDRSRYLAAQSALVLAERSGEVFDSIRLTEPLKQSLARKQDALEKAIDAYHTAQSFGIAEVNSQGTYAIAELYRGLAKDLLESEPPSELNDLQRQQYRLLLAEQAYPFEEEAIALYERNQAMIADGHWNPWIDRSLQALAEIFPARYARQAKWMDWSTGNVATGKEVR